MESIPAKSIVTRVKQSGWFGCDYNMNIYRGCCHGCIYCDSRSDCYGTEEFDRVRVKADALRIIRDELRRKVVTGVVSTGAMSDPYNPFEADLQLTRHALELLNAFGFGVAVATKSDLITRDIDLFTEISRHSPVLCKITITTVDDDLCARVEPGAPPASRRLAAIEELSRAGLFVGVLLMPVLPFLEDDDEGIVRLVDRVADCGARFIYPAFGVTLRQNQREFFLQKLEEVFPGQGLAQQYIRAFGTRYNCVSPHARVLWRTFSDACRRRGLLYSMPQIISAYKTGYDSSQLSLFP